MSTHLSVSAHLCSIGVTLSSIMTELDIRHVDIWVLDVEGAEVKRIITWLDIALPVSQY